MDHSILSRLRAAPLALALALALLLGAVIVAVGSAEASGHKKTFEVGIDPNEVVADMSTEIRFTIRNTAANPISLNAVNITIPDGITVDEEYGIIELRDLALAKGESEMFAFYVTAECSETAYEWPVEASQANDFKGDNNRFTLVGGNPLLEVPCTGDSDPPDPVTKTCTGSGPCEVELEFDNTAVKLTASRNTTLFLSLSPASEFDMAFCDGAFDKSAAILFDVRGNQISKIIEITLSGIYPNDFKPDDFKPDDFEVCFGADKSFKGSELDDELGFWVGIIDECGDDWPKGRPFPGPSQEKPTPCVMSIELIKADDNSNKVVIVVWSPPGDPLIKIG